MSLPDLERMLEARLEELGFEMVEARWAGSSRRPILRVRIDLPDSAPGQGVTIRHCAGVSRELERLLEGCGEIPERYVLEVSSPGVDRPLTRPRDWIRFQGERAVVKGAGLPGAGGGSLEGEILRVEEEGPGHQVLLRLQDGQEVRIPLAGIKEARLVFRWE